MSSQDLKNVDPDFISTKVPIEKQLLFVQAVFLFDFQNAKERRHFETINTKLIENVDNFFFFAVSAMKCTLKQVKVRRTVCT